MLFLSLSSLKIDFNVNDNNQVKYSKILVRILVESSIFIVFANFFLAFETELHLTPNLGASADAPDALSHTSMMTLSFDRRFPFLGRIRFSSRKKFVDNFGSLQEDVQSMRLIEEIAGDKTYLEIDGLIPDTDYELQVLNVKSGVEV